MSEPVTPLRAFRTQQKPKVPLRTIASAMGITEGQLSRIEREGTDKLPVAIKLSEITGLPVESFVKPMRAA